MRHNHGMRFLRGALLCGALLAGCYVDDGARPVYGGGYVAAAGPSVAVGVGGPSLYEIQPGIQVVQDYDYPVFYSDNLYWRYDGGIWYSSRWHDRGWVTSYNVPGRIRGIDRPGAYVHYRSPSYRGAYSTGYRGGYRGSYHAAPVYRKHR